MLGIGENTRPSRCVSGQILQCMIGGVVSHQNAVDGEETSAPFISDVRDEVISRGIIVYGICCICTWLNVGVIRLES